MSIEKLQHWLKPGILGFYNSCEVTICGLLDHNDTVHNLFTLFTFESCKAPEAPTPHFLTRKNERFGEQLRLIVVQYSISLDDAIKVYCEILSGVKQVNTPLGPLSVSKLALVPATFVPIDSTKSILMNKVLKNNFCGGSMVLEWFGTKGAVQELLEAKKFQKALLRIRELLPIDLFSVSDRVGNVLFQLPEQIAFCQLSGSKDQTTCTIVFDKRVDNLERYTVSAMTDIDHLLVDFRAISNITQHEWTIALDETGGPYVITVMDTENHIPILQQTTSMIRNISNILTFCGDLDCVRTITTNDSTKNIIVNSSQRITTGKSEYPWKAAIQQRHYQKRIKELVHNREFIRYGKGSNDRSRGLSDLRSLMNVSVNTRVCLWDPYLNAKDLLETWYHTDSYGLELRAITSNKFPQKANISLDSWIEEQRKILLLGSNQYGINLQWRVQHDSFGFSFHDRFLILLPPDGETPKVWSLGTSVNSFGKNHHILQLVSNPGYIFDAFEELWVSLADSSCQIWNSKEAQKYGQDLGRS